MRSPSHTRRRAKTLRGSLSPPEVLLWARLRARVPGRPTIRRQHPIGPYVADFYCAAARLVIEIDGAGHGEEAQMAHDQRRDRYMERLGYRVVRCSAADVMADPDEVAQGIVDTASPPPPLRVEANPEAVRPPLCAPSVSPRTGGLPPPPRRGAGEE